MVFLNSSLYFVGLFLLDMCVFPFCFFLSLILTHLSTFLGYIQSHTVPEKERMLHFDRLNWQELIVGEPEYEKEYFTDRYLVTGHTPTDLIDESCSGRIYQKNSHIAIDCGAVFGNPLGCICLNTLEEFYAQ